MALTSKRVLKLLRRGEPGKHFDRHGLYLVTVSRTAAHWEKRYQLDGKEHYHGLGSAFAFSLAEARVRNRRVSQQLADKIDPIEQKRMAKAERVAAAAKVVTFGVVAQDYFNAHSPGWKHPKHIQQWRSSVLGLTMNGAPAEADYCRILRSLPVAKIDTPIILQALKPLWETKPETMSRVRARIAAVIDYATAAQYRQGDNPAAWNLVNKLLPTNGKRGNHFGAVDYREIPAFVADLRAHEGTAARCLEFLIYTAARSTEARGATWGEINFDEKLWRIPAHRMKGGKEHVVPLAPEAIKLLRGGLPREGDGDDALIFIGRRPGVPLTDLALMTLMRKMGRAETVHGFRSSFSDWAHERTAHSAHCIELSLAHSIGAAAEKAYRRGDMVEKRYQLMQAWAAYCSSPPVATRAAAEPIPIGRGRA
jgi:integrase